MSAHRLTSRLLTNRFGYSHSTLNQGPSCSPQRSRKYKLDGLEDVRSASMRKRVRSVWLAVQLLERRSAQQSAHRVVQMGKVEVTDPHLFIWYLLEFYQIEGMQLSRPLVRPPPMLPLRRVDQNFIEARARSRLAIGRDVMRGGKNEAHVLSISFALSSSSPETSKFGSKLNCMDGSATCLTCLSRSWAGLHLGCFRPC